MTALVDHLAALYPTVFTVLVVTTGIAALIVVVVVIIAAIFGPTPGYGRNARTVLRILAAAANRNRNR